MERDIDYNYVGSVVDYFQDFPDLLQMIRLKALRAENDCHKLNDRTGLVSENLESLRETVVDLMNYAAYLYCYMIAEEVK